MAVIATSTQVKVLYDSNVVNDGTGERIMLARIRRVATADTWDVAAFFSEINSATFIASGVLTAVGSVGVAGTVLTLTLASLDTDTVYLTIKGQSAP